MMRAGPTDRRHEYPLPDDIEAIAALKRIPQTRDGPDWRRGSDADVALAVKLFERARGFLSDVAKSDVRKQGGAIRHKDRAEHLKQYVDDPLALVDDDDETDPWGADSGWGDIESNLVIWCMRPLTDTTLRGTRRGALGSPWSSRAASAII